ncbi:MAG: hypothetical protein ACI8ZN_000600 [Bacteroidia bacterium]|jgi:hypothetical protein
MMVAVRTSFVLLVFGLVHLSSSQRSSPPNGTVFPTFNLTNSVGLEVSNEDFEWNYVLYEFWSPTCKRCVIFLDQMVRLDSAYANQDFVNGKGLKVVSICLSEDSLAWVHLSAHFKLNAATNFYESKPMESKLANELHVSYLPYNFLVNGKGVIVAQGLHGASLAEKILEFVSP